MMSNVSEYTPIEAALHDEVAAWLEVRWDPEMDGAEWRRIVVDSGWAFPAWPTECYGRGLPPELSHVVETEFERIGAPSPGFGPDRIGLGYFLAGTILAHGSEDMKRTQLRHLLYGEVGDVCLFYSEPGAGSDLAGLQTRADRDGDGYRINGQKIWSSGAESAEWGCLLARTNWDVPKHRGISFFLFPIVIDGVRQSGVDIRPIKQMTGQSHFNEVFFTDAWVPAKNLVGEENDGWRVLQTALMYERMSMDGRSQGAQYRPDRDPQPTAGLSVLHGAAELIEAARSAKRDKDPHIRQMIAQIHTWRLAQEWSRERAIAETQSGTSSVASIGKLANSRTVHATGNLLRLIDGPRALLYDYENVDVSTSNFRAMWSFVYSIGGGTDQIQKNIVGERILQLPKGPELDRDRPFRDVPKGVAIRKFS